MIGDEVKIDLLGQYYTAINNPKNPGVFALAVHLKVKVDPQILQKALNDLLKRLPFFNSKIKKGFFQYYLQEMGKFPQIEAEGKSPLFDDFYNHGSGHVIKIVFGPKHFTVKATHSICDGRGLAKFTVALLTRYYELLGIKINKQEVIDCKAKYRIAESEDAIKEHIFKPRTLQKNDESLGEVYQVPIINENKQYLHSECFDSAVIKKKCKEQGISISQYLLEVIFEVIKNKRVSEKKQGKIVGSLQIDCRPFFPSETLRSFVTAKNIVMPDSGSLDRARKDLREQLHGINGEYIQNKMYEQKRLFSLASYVPLAIKDLFMKKIAHLDASGTTTGLSNLGVIQIPKEIESFIDYFEFPIAIEEGISQFFSCVTVGTNLTVTATFYEGGRPIVEEVFQKIRNK